MFVATWQGAEIARGAEVIEVEGRLYFRPEDVRLDCLRDAPDRSVCEWKGGEADYFDVVVGDAANRAAAWRYRALGEYARAIVGRFAFWRGVEVAWDGPGASPAPLRIEPLTPNVAKALGASDVVWRPASVRPFDGQPAQGGFEGYLISSLGVLVDVLATPPESERAALIAAAKARADRVVAWNRAHPGDRFGYVAVWGSAPPDAETVGVLQRRGVVLALEAQPTIIG